MSKLKVLMLSQWYPLTMSRYFESAFSRREDVDLRTVGPYTGNKIPWKGGMELPLKYAKSPYYPTFPNTNVLSWNTVKVMLGDWTPDLVLTVDAGIRFDRKPTVGSVIAHVATDPHVLNYDVARSISDKFFNMQLTYSKGDDIYLPYAFDPSVHFREELPKEYDCALIGMPYPSRMELVDRLRAIGKKVNFQNGPVFDEYRQENCKASIGINYSSLLDMTARVFELMAMGLAPVLNRVPDLSIFFEEGEHYLGFGSVEEAVSKISTMTQDSIDLLSMNALREVWEVDTESGFPKHSYDNRVYHILKVCELL